MNRLEKGLLWLAGWIATRRPVPSRYSPSSTSNNFTYLGFEEAGNPRSRFLVTRPPCREGLSGISWPNEDKPSEETSIRFSELMQLEYDIQRVYKTTEVRYRKLTGFILGNFFQKHRFVDFRERLAQRAFARSFRFSGERMNILRKIVDWRRRGVLSGSRQRITEEPFSYLDAYTAIFSERAWGLKELDAYLEELRFVMDSLVASGELSYDGNRYKLTGKSLQTLADFEQSNRRHRDNRNLNLAIVILTLVIAASTAVSVWHEIFWQ